MKTGTVAHKHTNENSEVALLNVICFLLIDPESA
jgi:hypothetical protein